MAVTPPGHPTLPRGDDWEALWRLQHRGLSSTDNLLKASHHSFKEACITLLVLINSSLYLDRNFPMQDSSVQGRVSSE